MEENTQLPKEVVEEIRQKAEDFANNHINGRAQPDVWEIVFRANEAGATAYATKLHQVQTQLTEEQQLRALVMKENDFITDHFDRLQKEVAVLKAQPSAVWVKADTKPEHNVGVLVFIPGEDNHITSGMWDISNKWVLLDEYRTPEEEVTYWMPLPAFPEGYPAYELPDEIGAMIKKIAREELGKKEQPAEGREDAVEFAEWLLEYGYEPSFEKKWVDYSKTGDNRVSSAQLYELFKQQK